MPGTVKAFSVGRQRINSFRTSLLIILYALLGAGDITVDFRQIKPLFLWSLQMNHKHVNKLDWEIGSNGKEQSEREMREVVTERDHFK